MFHVWYDATNSPCSMCLMASQILLSSVVSSLQTSNWSKWFTEFNNIKYGILLISQIWTQWYEPNGIYSIAWTQCHELNGMNSIAYTQWIFHWVTCWISFKLNLKNPELHSFFLGSSKITNQKVQMTGLELFGPEDHLLSQVTLLSVDGKVNYVLKDNKMNCSQGGCLPWSLY